MSIKQVSVNQFVITSKSGTMLVSARTIVVMIENGEL